MVELTLFQSWCPEFHTKGFLHLLAVADKNPVFKPFVYLRKFLLGVCTFPFVFSISLSESAIRILHNTLFFSKVHLQVGGTFLHVIKMGMSSSEPIGHNSVWMKGFQLMINCLIGLKKWHLCTSIRQQVFCTGSVFLVIWNKFI